jgi:hypothetical protein
MPRPHTIEEDTNRRRNVRSMEGVKKTEVLSHVRIGASILV